VEVHEQRNDYERWRLLDFEEYKPLTVRPDEKGRITVGTRVRAGLSRWFFEDRVMPVTQKELEDSRH
jgi:ubiquinol-cytochrome c reductase cytochrome b subunit